MKPIPDYYSRLNRNDGSRQAARLAYVLQPDYIPVDERGLPQLITHMRAYAQKIHFYNTHNRTDGTWLSLFENNDALMLAEAINFNAKQISDQYTSLSKNDINSRIEAVMAIIRWYDRWLTLGKNIKNGSAQTVLATVKSIVRTKLKKHALNTLILAALHKQETWPKLNDLGVFWGIENPEAYVKQFRQQCKTKRRAEEHLNNSFNAFLRARIYVAKQAMAVFDRLLTDQTHEPAAAMLLAFLQTYKKSQHIINRFPERLFKFYYDDVLKNQPEQGLGDRLFLLCNKARSGEPVVIESGTLFHAGKTPELQDILYQSTDSAVITGSILTALQTIFLQRHINISPENATASVSRIKNGNLLALQNKNTKNNESDNPNSGDIDVAKNNIFGFDDGLSQSSQGEDANIGFYLTSELLSLKEGSRKITLKFEFADKTLDRFIVSIGKGVGNYLHKPCVDECIAGCKQEGGVHIFSDLDEGLLGLAYCLYECLDDILKSWRETPNQIKAFLDGLNSHIVQSLIGDDSSDAGGNIGGNIVDAELVLEFFWIHLYIHAKDMKVISHVHHQLISRKIFNMNYRFANRGDDSRESRHATRQQISEELNINTKQSMQTSLDAKMRKLVLEKRRQRMRKAQYRKLLKRVNNLPEEDDQQRMLKEDLTRDIVDSEFALLMRYFSDAFSFQLSQERDWLLKTNYTIAHLPRQNGFQITLLLSGEVNPIVATNPEVHGNIHTSALPTLIMGINPLTRVYPYSQLQPFLINEASISVSVDGLRDVVVHNEYGRVDSKKPFMPFSAIPRQDSRFYLGAYEYAKKNVTAISATFTWKNLPKDYGGLASYYRGYGSGFSNNNFSLNVTMLANGELVPSDESLQQDCPLFEFSQNTNTLCEKTHLKYRYRHANPKIDMSMTKKEYEALVNVEHAFMCFRLRSSPKAFGHKTYPNLLSEVLTHNSRSRKKKPLISEPYTPEIARVEMSYTAQEKIFFPNTYQQLTKQSESTDGINTTAQTSAYYQTPMGLELVHRRSELSGVALFPQWQEDGNLYIGFNRPQNSESLCLYFQLNKDATHRANTKTHGITWRYYTSHGWQRLAADKILSDSTNGLMHSGIVNIELPEDFIPHLGFMPASQYWLRIASSVNLARYASFKGLNFDAISLESVSDASKLSAHSNGISKTWRPLTRLPGIQSCSQTQAAFFNSDTETNRQARVRTYERLRHKNRAITPWDYERIVLEKFPEVDLVKCLPACKLNCDKPVPGSVLIVVMPRLLSKNNVNKEGHYLNSVALTRIATTLKEVSSNNVNLEVVNAVYEYIQVRCAVQFSDRIYLGERIKKLQEDISAYISPWSNVGLSPKLAWVVRAKEVEAFINQLDYVNTVAKVSLVKRYSNNQYPEYFQLLDTADTTRAPQTPDRTSMMYDPSVYAKYPWSLPLPSKHHYIEIITSDNTIDTVAQAVGISRLEVGNTFVIRAPDKKIATARKKNVE